MAQKEVDIFGSLFTEDEKCNYTMVVQEYFVKPILGRIAYVEHDGHMHIVFASSPTNSTRRARRILEQMHVPAEQWPNCLRSKQLVRNTSALFRYMNGRGKVVRTCTFYDNIYQADSLDWPDCSTIPSEHRRKLEAENEVSRKRARVEKTYDLARKLLDRRITHVSQLNEKFDLAEMAQLMIDFGNSYKETVGMILANLRQARLKEEREKPYADLLHRELEMAYAGKPRHDCSGLPFTLSKCPVTLCACHLRELFKRYGFYGDSVQAIEIPENAEFIYQTQNRTSTEEYDIEEDGFLLRVPPRK